MSDENYYQATPKDVLLKQLADPCCPKSEREWAAAKEIEAYQVKVARLLNLEYEQRKVLEQALEALDRSTRYMKCTEAVFSQGRMYLDMTLMPSLAKQSEAAITAIQDVLK